MMSPGSTSQAGTQMYMAPELQTGQRATPRSDTYSVGVVLYQLLLGDFSRPLTTDWSRKVNDSLLREDLEQCFAGNPEERFVGVGQLAKSLRSLDKRHQELAEQKAELAAKESAGYRRGIMRTTAVAALIVATFAVLAFYAIHNAKEQALQRQRADSALTRLEIQRAEEFFKADDSASALALLAHVLRRNPTNRMAAERLMSALNHRNFALPVLEFTGREPQIFHAEFNRDGSLFVTVSHGGTAHLWDVRTGVPLETPLKEIGRVNSAHFSPDGHRIVTAGRDGYARVFHLASKMFLAQLRHSGPVISAQFSPDGRRVGSVSDGGRTASSPQSGRAGCLIWDATTGEPVVEVMLPSRILNEGQNDVHETGFSEIHAVEFSAEGDKLLVCTESRAFLCDVTTGQITMELQTQRHHGFSNWHARLSPDGRFVAAVDGSLHIWDTPSGKIATELLQMEITNFESFVRDFEFSPEGSRVVVADNTTARVWDTRTGEPLMEPIKTSKWFNTVRFCPDGSRLITTSGDGRARIWNAQTGAALCEPIILRGLSDDFNPDHAEFSPDGRRFITAGFNHGIITVWNIDQANALPKNLLHDFFIDTVRLSADGRHGIVGAGTHDRARIWDVDAAEPIVDIGDPVQPSSQTMVVPQYPEYLPSTIDMNEEGNIIVTTLLGSRGQFPYATPVAVGPSGFFGGNTTQVWHLEDGHSNSQTLPHNGVVNSVILSPDGRTIAASVHEIVTDNATSQGPYTLYYVYLWDSAHGETIVPPLKHPNLVTAIDFHPDGNQIVTASDTVRIWNVQSGRLATEFPAKASNVFWVRFSGNGKRVATASSGGTALVWDSESGHPVIEPLRHEEVITRIAFSPNNEKIVTASRDHTARIWDAETGQPLTEPLRHSDVVTEALFTGDGQRVVTASKDGTVGVWDAETGQPLSESFKHQGHEAGSIDLDKDGERIAVTSGDAVMVWQLPRPSLPVPIWFAELTEGIAGKRLNDQKVSESLTVKSLSELRQRVIRSDSKDYNTQWAKWFFADRSKRAISFGSQISMPKYVEGLIEAGKFWEAIRLSPTNALAFSGLARLLANRNPEHFPQTVFEADFYCRRAEDYGPNAPEVWWARAEILDRKGHIDMALDLLDRAIESQPDNAEFLEAKALMLEKNSRPEEAYLSFVKVIGQMSTNDPVELAKLARRILDKPRDPGASDSASDKFKADWLTRRATELDPKNSATWRTRAGILEQIGKLNDAIVAMQHAIDGEPNSPSLRSVLASLLIRANRLGEARQASAKARELERSIELQEMQGSSFSNGRFERGSGQNPDAWSTGSWQPQGVQFEWETGSGRNQSRCISIHLTEPNEAYWKQEITTEPGAWFNVYAYIKGQNITNHENGSIGANLCNLGTWDRSDDLGSLGTFDWNQVVFTCQAGPSGKVDIGCRLGYWGNTVTGQAWFDDIYTADDFAPSWNGKHVQLNLEKQDLTAVQNSSVTRWLEQLDQAYEKYLELTGYRPFNGETIGIGSVRQYPGGWTVSGNPIKWMQRYVKEELTRIEQSGDWSFGILHELGHNFDSERWNWEAEFWANFKMYYVIENLNGTVFRRNVSYQGAQLEKYYLLRTQEAKAQGQFEFDSLVYRFIKISQKIGWKPFQETFGEFLNLSPDRVPTTRIGKFNLFLDSLTKFAQLDVRTLFTAEELPEITRILTP